MNLEKQITLLNNLADETKRLRMDLLEEVMILKKIKAGHLRIAKEWLNELDTAVRDDLLISLDKKTREKLGYEDV